MMAEQTRRLVEEIRTQLGDPAGWGAPVEFGDSLALCVLNSAYSLRATSTSVVNVLDRYRRFRERDGGNASTDSGRDLLRAMDTCGGAEPFARQVLKSDKKLPGTRRLAAVGVYDAVQSLAERGVTTASELRAAAGDPEVKRAWLAVPGLGAMSWAYVCMNAGVVSETKVDTMISRFVNGAVGKQLAVAQAGELVKAAARELGVETRALDRAIWLHTSRSKVR